MRHFFPVSRHRQLEREQLVGSALAGDPALVLLWGGGGAGKSIAASQIAKRLSRAGTPAVWVRLGEGRTDAVSAWQSILSALLAAGLLPADGAAARLQEGELVGEVERLLWVFQEEAPDRLVLVLDDAHLVSDPGFEVSLLGALESRGGLQLILTSRSRLPRVLDIESRVKVPVREITAEQLRLSRDEIDRLLGERLPKLGGDERERIGTIISRDSGGWPIAAHAAVVDYAASGRPPSATRREFVSRHVDRLLQDASRQRREVLCATALFSEISTPIVARIFDIELSEATALLAAASEASAGYWEEPDGTRWYRHHDLVLEELQRRAEEEVGEERLRMLYSRAVAEFEQARPRFAVQAALRAGAWEPLQSLLLERGFQSVIRRDERIAGPWLRDIPSDVRERYPILAAFALIDEYAFPRGRFERVITGLKTLAGPQLAVESAKAGLPGAVASAFRMVAARLSGNEELGRNMAERFEEAVEQLGETEAERMRRPLAVGTVHAAITHLHAERFDDAERVLQRIDAHRDGEETVASAHMIALEAFSAASRGWMPEARDAVARCEQRDLPEGWHSAYSGAGYRIAAALLLLEADDTGAAERHLEELAPHEPTIEHWPYLVALRTLIAESRSGPRTALTGLEWQLRRRRSRAATLPTHKRALAELRARLQWHAGLMLPRGLRNRKDISGVYALLAAARPDAARALIGVLQQDIDLGGFPRRGSQLLLLQADAARCGGDTEVSARLASLGAELMNEHGLRLPGFALPASRVRALAELAPDLEPWVIPGSASEPLPGISALTAGEHRALAAVSEHGSTASAAKALYLSRETVKSQLQRVYRKLGVRSRDDALRVAADAGLLDSGPIGDAGGRDYV